MVVKELDPFEQFESWFEQARAQESLDPCAMTLATVDRAYHVSARVVLMKAFSKDGVVFFTNYDSPKAKALEEIPEAAAVFWWPVAQRQIRIVGKVSKVSDKESDRYFDSRSFESRVAAIVSKQSQLLLDHDAFMNAYQRALHEPACRPQHWGGYRLAPTRFEFWQGRPHRLHDRREYVLTDNQWHHQSLYP